jgi:hypothetical protein
VTAHRFLGIFTSVPYQRVISAATHTIQDSLSYTKKLTELPPLVYQELLLSCCPPNPLPEDISKLKKILEESNYNAGVITPLALHRVLTTLLNASEIQATRKLLQYTEPVSIWMAEDW